MNEALRGRRALVTGASRGIGTGIALALAEAGADVAIGYRREEAAAAAVAEQIEGLGRRAATFRCDVRERETVDAMVEGARRALGGLDVVVANAGVASRFQPLHEVEPGFFERVIAIDLVGVFHTVQAALPPLRDQAGGVILVISSIAADACQPGGGPYVAAKAGVNALSVVVARENADRNVRCNVIAPGLIDTEMARGMIQVHGDGIVSAIPLGRMGRPDEVGRLAVYLASDDAAWITGKVFRIDGGAL